MLCRPHHYVDQYALDLVAEKLGKQLGGCIEELQQGRMQRELEKAEREKEKKQRQERMRKIQQKAIAKRRISSPQRAPSPELLMEPEMQQQDAVPNMVPQQHRTGNATDNAYTRPTPRIKITVGPTTSSRATCTAPPPAAPAPESDVVVARNRSAASSLCHLWKCYALLAFGVVLIAGVVHALCSR